MPYFFYERDFARRWIPKITSDPPRKGEAGVDKPPERSDPIHAIPDHESLWHLDLLVTKYPPPKEKPNV